MNNLVRCLELEAYAERRLKNTPGIKSIEVVGINGGSKGGRCSIQYADSDTAFEFQHTNDFFEKVQQLEHGN